MRKHVFTVLVLALTGLMIAISPIATTAIADHVACKQQAASAPTEMMHGHHGHQTPAAAAPASEQVAESSFALPPCCDHGCFLGATLLPEGHPGVPPLLAVPTAWTVTHLSDLTEPHGLRRPPKA